MKPTVYLVKNPITNNGNTKRKYFEFLSTAIIPNKRIKIEIDTEGKSIKPLDKFIKT